MPTRSRDNGSLSLADAVARVEARLRQADLAYGHGTDNPRDEAAWLVLAAAGLSPVDPVDVGRLLTADEWASAQRLLERRLEERRPLAYLTGSAWFAGLEFEVDERVLVPRSPLAELIVERFAPWLPDRPVERILEIGTGSGCIAVACAVAFPEARIDATDIDDGALALARRNAARHGVADRCEFLRADVYEGLPAGRRYDLIVSNPPYVDATAMQSLPPEYRHEPGHALDAGADGLDVAVPLLEGARRHLAPGGLVVLEVGNAADALAARFPRLPLIWPEFERGGVGVAVVGAEDLAAG